MKSKKLIILSVFAALHNTQNAAAETPEKWMARIRVLGVVPQTHSTITPVHGHARVTSAVTPEVDLSYFIMPNLAAEIIAATCQHKVTAKLPGSKIKAGSVWLLPPTLTLQYHFMPQNCVDPYVGGGVNYTFFYKEKPGPVLKNVSYKDRFGLALQAGVDVKIIESWYFNVDVKKIWLKTKASFLNKTVIANVRLDPWLFGAGIGYRF